MVEMEDLFAEMEIFEQRRPSGPLAQTVLIVNNRDALLRRQGLGVTARDLMDLAARAWVVQSLPDEPSLDLCGANLGYCDPSIVMDFAATH